MVHDEGDIGIARAAAQAKTVMVMSSMSNHTHAEVAKAVPGAIRWAQLYIFRDPGLTREVIDRIAEAGFNAIVVTIDGFINGLRERDMRNNFTLREGLGLPCAPSLPTSSGTVTPEQVAETWEPGIGWQHIEQCRSMTPLPVALKGILSPADAVEAANRGVDAIVVSNHGGRQLDTVPATVDALPTIADAVGGRAEIFMDGGVRRGTDVVKALALGARAVLVGRPTAFALAVGGSEAVSRMLEILAAETANAVSLAGYSSACEITREAVVHAP
jgi:isopentenyl diphosphate isomerase/L-lactate dehydrogenase-like FMN-dependent dehydrogenase